MTWNGEKVLKPEDTVPEADAVIITLNEYQSVMSYLKRKVEHKLVPFVEILAELENPI